MTTRALAIGFTLALAAASCSGKSKCDANSCTGCCVDANTCVDGTTKAQCGANGESCQACSGICFMHKCSGGSGGGAGGGAGGGGGGTDGGTDAGVTLPCPQSCAGCCNNGLCYLGTDVSNCGKGGLACSSCSANQSCTNNTCTDPSCAGCVSGATCRSQVNNSFCGAAGGACFDCTGFGGTCSASTGSCTGGQCPTGCFDTLGRCQSGQNKGYCGTGGGACTACPAGQGCSDGGCITLGGSTLPGDDCSNVVETLSLQTPNLMGTTTGYANDTAGSCGGTSGADRIYVLDLTTGGGMVDVTVAPRQSTFQPVVYVRVACDSMELACGAAAGGGSSATAHLQLGANRVYVVVDGLNGTSGDFTLNLNYTP